MTARGGSHNAPTLLGSLKVRRLASLRISVVLWRCSPGRGFKALLGMCVLNS